jgi:uncharacterized phiE125 gp8 family phage protein
MLDLATAKASQKIETTDEDAVLTAFLNAAISAVETRTGKNLTAKDELQVESGFNCSTGFRSYRSGGAIHLWKGPVSAITSVKYDDANGVEQTFSSYRLVPGINARLLPAYGQSWPTTSRGDGTVRISYVAGYASDQAPADLEHAVLLLFGHFNANREAVIASERAAAVELPLGVASLIEPYCSAWTA